MPEAPSRASGYRGQVTTPAPTARRWEGGASHGKVVPFLRFDDRAEETALNGGPEFSFTEAVSFEVRRDDQGEVDELWSKLSEGGEEGPCGWLRDRYGLSWQILPRALEEMLRDEDPEKAERVMAAMLSMRKIDLSALERAYEAA